MMGLPQAGQRPPVASRMLYGFEFSGLLERFTLSTAGMISPAFSTSTVSPMRTSLRSISSWLWRVARATVEPESSTGRSSATGVSTPVRPTWTTMFSRVVSFCSGGNL